MIIGVYGYTDKRPVIYTLMHLLQTLGDVAVITRNRHFTRLIEGHADMGHIGNTLVCVTDLSPDEVWKSIQYTPDNFLNIIYDLQDTIAKVDVNIHVLGSEYEDGELDFLECLDPQPVKMKLLYDKQPSTDKDTYNIQIGPEYLGLVEYIERNKELKSLGNKFLAKSLASILTEPLNLSERTLFNILVGRRG